MTPLFSLVVSTVVRSLLSPGSQKRVLNFQFPLRSGAGGIWPLIRSTKKRGFLPHCDLTLQHRNHPFNSSPAPLPDCPICFNPPFVESCPLPQKRRVFLDHCPRWRKAVLIMESMRASKYPLWNPWKRVSSNPKTLTFGPPTV